MYLMLGFCCLTAATKFLRTGSPWRCKTGGLPGGGGSIGSPHSSQTIGLFDLETRRVSAVFGVVLSAFRPRRWQAGVSPTGMEMFGPILLAHGSPNGLNCCS